MALTKGQLVALYLLVSSDSDLRRKLEGRPGSLANPGIVNPATGKQDIYDRFNTYAPNLNILATDFPVNLRELYSPTGRNGVATDPSQIVFAMDGIYDPEQGPCPGLADSRYIFSRLTGMP